MPNQKPGCFSGILRAMLCTGHVPTHPSSPSSNHVTRPNNSTKINFIDREQEEDHHSGPTLVARLMGLDSLPPNTHLSLQSATPDSLSRSRSVNFVDFLSKLDLAEPRQSLHRRAITSVSFREVHLPGTSPRSNEVKDRSTRPKRKKQKNSGKGGNDDGITKLKDKDRKKAFPRALKKSCERENGVLGSSLPRERRCSRTCEKARASGRENGKEVTEKFVRRRKNEQDGSKKSMALQSSHETRSPISALDVTRFSGNRRSSICRPLKNIDLTVKLRPEVACHIGDDNKTQLSYEELARELVNLTTRDVSESYWISNANNIAINFQGLEELCVEFEGPILDFLLQEITTEILHM